MKRTLLIASCLVVPIAALCAVLRSATAFTFKDPKGVNTIRFTLDGRLEQLSGWTSGVSGDLTFDPDSPTSLKGTVTVDATTIAMSHANMTEHLKEPMWLDTANHPTVTFAVTKVEDPRPVEGQDRAWDMKVTGDFTLRGVTKALTVPVRVTYLPGQLSKRNRGAGDVAVVRTSFTIKRSDFGVEGNQPLDLVADEIQVSVTIAAFAPKVG